MKVIKSFVLFAAAAAALASCNKENTVPSLVDYSFVLDTPDTKSTIDFSSEGPCAQWESGDFIGVFAGSNANAKGAINIATDPVTLTLSASAIAEGTDIYTYYPYKDGVASAQSVSMSIPATQYGRLNSMPMVGVPCKMTSAGTTSQSIHEQNLGGLFRFNVFSTNEAYQKEYVQYVVFTSQEKCCGDFAMDITNPNLDITVDGGNTIVAHDNAKVGTSKQDAGAVKMVVAPGEYHDVVVSVVTNAAMYTYTLNAAQVARSFIRTFNIDLKNGERVSVNGNVTVNPTTIGATDNTTPWWTAFSQPFDVPVGKKLTLTFDCHGNNTFAEEYHHSWILGVSNPCAPGEINYKEYFVLRADAWGWKNGNSQQGIGGEIVNDYWEPGKLSSWAYFNSLMFNAKVTIVLTHSADGMLSAVASSGSTGYPTITESYSMMTSTQENVWAFLTVDLSHLENLKAVLEDYVPEPVLNIEATATAYVIGKEASADHVAKVSLGKENIKVTLDGQPVNDFSVIYNTSLDNGTTGIYDAKVGLVKNAFKVVYNGKQYPGSLNILASTLPAQTGIVGNADNTTGFWQAFTQDWKVNDGESQTVSFTLGSAGGENFHCADVILRKADKVEYGVVRMDHYGWGNSYNENYRYSNWNFDVFKSRLNGSKVSVTVSNVGGKTAIRYYVQYTNNEQHYQYYTNLAVTADDVYFTIMPEMAHLEF